MIKKAMTVISVLFFVSLLHPVQVKKKEVVDFQSFLKGHFSGTGLTQSGELFISLKNTKIEGPEREYYLSGDVSGQGDIYLGTGHIASVFKVGRDGKITEMFTATEPDIYALHYGSDSSIYAGSSPRGKLYRITQDLKVKELFDPDENYIWDIKEDSMGNIICAVGGSGGVYLIDKQGNPKNIFTPDDTHILSLFVSKDNTIYAGSGGSGIVYKISSQKTAVVYDSPFEEINGIYEDPDGNVWFAASRELKKKKLLVSSDGTGRMTFPVNKPGTEEKSALYIAGPGGWVEKVWSSREESIYSVTPDKKNGGVLIATGDRGRIYRIGRDKRFSLIYEGDSAQTYKIEEAPDGFVVIGNNTSSITRLSSFPDTQGVYTSEIFNLEIMSKAGRLYWDPLTGSSPAVSLFVRSGNTSSPDSTWTDWSPPHTDNESTSINRSGIKYLQVRVNLNATPAVKSPGITGFQFYYMQQNLKPEIKEISIRLPIPVKHSDDSKKAPSVPKNTLLISWKAEDPNRDDLKYSLFLRKASGNEWIAFREDLREPQTELDMELYEDGDYILKVIADDSLSNSPETSGSDTLESKKFTIDSTAPVLSGFSVSGESATFTVTDSNSIISRVLYSFTGEKWFPLDPEDKLNDSRKETFRISGKTLSGKKLIFLKTTDEYKNSKVFQREL